MRAELLRKAGRAASWSSLARWLEAATSLLSLLVLVRVLGPETYGVYGMSLVVLALPSGLLGGPLADSLIQRRDLDRHHEACTFLADTVLSLVVGLALALSAPVIAEAFARPDLAPVVRVMSAGPFLASLGSVPGALLQRELRFGAITAVDAMGLATSSIVGVTLALSGFGVWSLVFMDLARRIVRSAGFCAMAHWRPHVKTSLRAFRELARFNAFTLAATLLERAEGAVPGAVVGGMLGAEALGYYNFASRLFAQSWGILLSPLQAVALPVAAYSQSEPETLRQILRQGLRLSTAVSYPFFIGAAVTAPVFVPLFFGSEWSNGVLTIQLMMLTGIRSATASFTGSVIRGAGRPGSQAALVALGLILALVSVPLVARLGLPAVVGAVLAKGLITWVVGAFALKRIIGYSVIGQLTVGWPSLAASAPMWGAAWVTLQMMTSAQANPWLTLLASAGAGALAYVLALAFIAPAFASWFLRMLNGRLSPAAVD
jgi:O-antigen/teichoic acid export membrane protein